VGRGNSGLKQGCDHGIKMGAGRKDTLLGKRGHWLGEVRGGSKGFLRFYKVGRTTPMRPTLRTKVGEKEGGPLEEN